MNEKVKKIIVVDLDGYQKIATVSINLPIRMPGNVIDNRAVIFNVYKGEKYKAIPIISDQLRKLTSIPPVIIFEISDNQIVYRNSKFRDVAADIYLELSKVVQLPLLSWGNNDHQRDSARIR